MSDDNQIEIPQSFTALFLEPGRNKPVASRLFIAQRYELCEDMAQLLTDTASNMLHGLGLAESDVLQRCGRGMAGADSPFSPAEAHWVLLRLAELLNWSAGALAQPD